MQRCRRGRDCTSVGASATYTTRLQACDMFRPLQTSSSSVTEAVESNRVGASVLWAGGRVGWFFRLPGSSPAHLGSACKNACGWCMVARLRFEERDLFLRAPWPRISESPEPSSNPVAKASGTATAHRIGSSRRTRGLTGRAVWPVAGRIADRQALESWRLACNIPYKRFKTSKHELSEVSQGLRAHSDLRLCRAGCFP